MQDTVDISCLDSECGEVLSIEFEIDETADRETWDAHIECDNCDQLYDVTRKDWSDEEGVSYSVGFYKPDAESVNYRSR